MLKTDDVNARLRAVELKMEQADKAAESFLVENFGKKSLNARHSLPLVPKVEKNAEVIPRVTSDNPPNLSIDENSFGGRAHLSERQMRSPKAPPRIPPSQHVPSLSLPRARERPLLLSLEETERLAAGRGVRKTEESLHAIDPGTQRELESLKEVITTERSRLVEEKQSSSRQMEKLRRENHRLKEEVNALTQQVKTSLQESSSMTSKYKSLDQMVVSLRASHESQKIRLESLERELEAVRDELDNEVALKTQLELELEKAKAKQSVSLQDKHLMDQRLFDLENEKRSLMNEKESLRTSLLSLQCQLDELKQQNSILVGERDRMRNEYDVVVAQLHELRSLSRVKENTEKELIKNLADQKNESHRLKIKLNELEQEVMSKEVLEKDCYSNRQEILSLKSSIASLKDELTLLRNENRITSTAKSKAEFNAKELTNELVALKHQLGALRQQARLQKSQQNNEPTPSTPSSSQAKRVALTERALETARSEALSANYRATKATVETTATSMNTAGLHNATSQALIDCLRDPTATAAVLSRVGDASPQENEPPLPQTLQPPSEGEVRRPPLAVELSPRSKEKYIESCQKQVIVLQMEQSSLESELSKLPNHTRGRTIRERRLRDQLEERLRVVECDIASVRKELRQLNSV